MKTTNQNSGEQTNYISDESFADPKQAVEEALAFKRAQRRDLHVTRIQAPRPPKDRMQAIKGVSRDLEKMKCNAGKHADNFFRQFFDDDGIPEHE